MRAVDANVGACVVDSLPFSQAGTRAQAVALASTGVEALVGYLGVINAERVGYVHASGMAFIPVTLAGEYNDGPADEVGQLRSLGMPDGATVFLDLEGLSAFRTDPTTLISKIDAWATAIDAAGFIPGLYVGAPQPLASDELWGLKVRRYWKGQGSTRDRHGALAEPKCGWCMTQIWPSVTRGQTWVDCNMVGQDYRKRVPTWVRQ